MESALRCYKSTSSRTVCLLCFFNDTATTEIYTLSLHDALPISASSSILHPPPGWTQPRASSSRSEEHTSELQSHLNLVCRLLLEIKKRHSYLLHALAARTGGCRRSASICVV